MTKRYLDPSILNRPKVQKRLSEKERMALFLETVQDLDRICEVMQLSLRDLSESKRRLSIIIGSEVDAENIRQATEQLHRIAHYTNHHNSLISNVWNGQGKDRFVRYRVSGGWAKPSDNPHQNLYTNAAKRLKSKNVSNPYLERSPRVFIKAHSIKDIDMTYKAEEGTTAAEQDFLELQKKDDASILLRLAPKRDKLNRYNGALENRAVGVQRRYDILIAEITRYREKLSKQMAALKEGYEEVLGLNPYGEKHKFPTFSAKELQDQFQEFQRAIVEVNKAYDAAVIAAEESKQWLAKRKNTWALETNRKYDQREKVIVQLIDKLTSYKKQINDERIEKTKLRTGKLKDARDKVDAFDETNLTDDQKLEFEAAKRELLAAEEELAEINEDITVLVEEYKELMDLIQDFERAAQAGGGE